MFRLVPVKKRQPLQHESPRVLDSFVIRAPVLQTVVGKVSDDVEPLLGRDVPVLLLLDLFENPGLDKSTPEVTKISLLIGNRHELKYF